LPSGVQTAAPITVSAITAQIAGFERNKDDA
jgi:hypothetical protein